MTKSRCSRRDLIWTPNYFGQTFGLRTHARPDLKPVCVSARDVFSSLVTGRCSVSVGDVSASLLRMCQRLSQGRFSISTTSWIEHTLFPTSIYLWDRAEKTPLRLGRIYVLGQTCNWAALTKSPWLEPGGPWSTWRCGQLLGLMVEKTSQEVWMVFWNRL